MVSGGQTVHSFITDLQEQSQMINICEVICISHNKQVCAEPQYIPLHVHIVCVVVCYMHLDKLAGTWKKAGMFRGGNLIVMPDKSCFLNVSEQNKDKN